MSTFSHREFKCAVCGNISEHLCMMSSNTMGAPDLDLRPAPMMRDTMTAWVHVCPFCGYASSDIDDETSITKDFLDSEKYKACDGFVFISKLAANFYQAYLIELEDQNIPGALNKLTSAIWVCDDEEDVKNAINLRKAALVLFDQLLKDKDLESDFETLMTQRADFMRRAELFDELVAEYEQLQFNDSLLDSIRKFQITRAKAHDTQCYTVNSVKTIQ